MPPGVGPGQTLQLQTPDGRPSEAVWSRPFGGPPGFQGRPERRTPPLSCLRGVLLVLGHSSMGIDLAGGFGSGCLLVYLGVLAITVAIELFVGHVFGDGDMAALRTWCFR